MSHLDNVSVLTRANVYFDGKCVSHTLLCADGSKKTVGVILPAVLSFKTDVPETMEGVAGRCRVRLEGEQAWTEYGPGERFSVPAHTRFEIEALEPYHYVCHFG